VTHRRSSPRSSRTRRSATPVSRRAPAFRLNSSIAAHSRFKTGSNSNSLLAAREELHSIRNHPRHDGLLHRHDAVRDDVVIFAWRWRGSVLPGVAEFFANPRQRSRFRYRTFNLAIRARPPEGPQYAANWWSPMRRTGCRRRSRCYRRAFRTRPRARHRRRASSSTPHR
jgi:hypothetical protein